MTAPGQRDPVVVLRQRLQKAREAIVPTGVDTSGLSDRTCYPQEVAEWETKHNRFVAGITEGGEPRG